jgi:hypothetical protein
MFFLVILAFAARITGGFDNHTTRRFSWYLKSLAVF